MSVIQVLLIDDEPAQAWLVQDQLNSASGKTGKEINLISVESLREGIRRLSQQNIDVLLLDLSLPDSYGADTFSKVRAQFPGLPTVVLTSLEDEDLGIRLLQSGAQDYLVKGQISDLILYRTIRHAIERKQTELALRESEEKYRILFESGNDAVWVHGFENGLPGKILQANHVACQRLGYSQEELLNMTPVDIDAPTRRDHVQRVVHELTSNNHALFETEHISKNGLRIPVEVSSRSCQIQGKMLIISIIRDITERKRAEIERERLILDLKDALSQVKALTGLLPICSSCKKIRDDHGDWSRLETYITGHSQAQFSHGLCPDCIKLYLPGVDD